MSQIAHDLVPIAASDRVAVDRCVDDRVAGGGRTPIDSPGANDVSEIKQALRRAEWSGRMLARTEALCRSGSFEVDLVDGNIVLSNGLRELLGLPQQTATGYRADTLDTLEWIPADELAFVSGFWRNARGDEPFEFQHHIVDAEGRRLVVLHRGVLGVDGDPQRGVALLQDITAQRAAERRIDELSNRDEITGLPNRAAFLDALNAAIHAAGWDGRAFSVLVLDVPRITEIQATMGFGAGDTLAMAIAARLAGLCGDADVVARLGGGEFAVLLDPERSADVRAVLTRAQVIRATLQEPERLGGTELTPTCIVGIASYPTDGDTPQRLLERAQTARLGAEDGAGIAFFTLESNVRALRELNLESALRQAVAHGELEVRYQPQVDLHTGAIVGVEALARWNSAQYGTIAPSEFIPLAERTELIVSLGAWILRRACEQSLAWRAAGLRPIRIGINLSPRELAQPDIAGRIQATLLATGADPSSIGLEITESHLMQDVERASQVLRRLKAIGLEIAIDDFGTGYSSLSCLRQMPFDVVKIDRSLVPDITAPTEAVSVTRGIITMAHALKMRVLAEGVETEGQLGLLVAGGCDLIQGYYFSRAVEANQIERMLRDERRLPERFLTRGKRTRTLLLVDDESNVVAALKRLFRREGYRLLVALSAAEGLQCLAENEVDVIVSDQRMPGMTGVEFLQRAKELYPDTVRIVLSGYTDIQSIIDAVNEGAIYKFLTKPWDDDRLLAHVAHAFQHKEMADENRRLMREVENANASLAAVNRRLQETLTHQDDYARVLEVSAGNSFGILDSVPLSVVGVDPDGLIAFANLEATRVFPELCALVGLPVRDALPQALAVLEAAEGSESRAVIGGRACRLSARDFHHEGTARGRLLMMMPEPGGAARGRHDD